MPHFYSLNWSDVLLLIRLFYTGDLLIFSPCIADLQQLLSTFPNYGVDIDTRLNVTQNSVETIKCEVDRNELVDILLKE